MLSKPDNKQFMGKSNSKCATLVTGAEVTSEILREPPKQNQYRADYVVGCVTVILPDYVLCKQNVDRIICIVFTLLTRYSWHQVTTAAGPGVQRRRKGSRRTRLRNTTEEIMKILPTL
ncbi:uncharacterized protein LOC143201060 [Rhynchophorus ferrugineus]|uniref:uncharacterized protein LOC143201060 n=1 Tax=Rhynchophorus ferrugineus TaxID=354439 RepID=UPI003FCD543C